MDELVVNVVPELLSGLDILGYERRISMRHQLKPEGEVVAVQDLPPKSGTISHSSLLTSHHSSSNTPTRKWPPSSIPSRWVRLSCDGTGRCRVRETSVLTAKQVFCRCANHRRRRRHLGIPPGSRRCLGVVWCVGVAISLRNPTHGLWRNTSDTQTSWVLPPLRPCRPTSKVTSP